MGLLDGALSGWLSSKKTAGQDSSNYFNISDQDLGQINQNLRDVLNFQGSDAATNPLESSRIATQEVMNNPLLSTLFGKGGSLQNAAAEESKLANQGYSLQPQDYEAYGQMSNDLARQFGQSDNSLAQALAQRGLSNSGVAGRAFATSEGNKMEQLAGLQRKIANDRMQNTMQRLAQTRQYMSQLGGLGENAIQQQFGRQQAAEGMGFNEKLAKNQAGEQRLNALQGQANEQLGQRMATQEIPGWAKAGMGGIQGYNNDLDRLTSIFGGGAPKKTDTAGQSYNTSGSIG